MDALSFELFQDLDRIAMRVHDHAIGGRQLKASAQRERLLLAFGEDRPDAERSTDFMANDQSTKRG